MSGVGGGRPHYVNRNEWDEHAREHWRRMAAERMSPRDRQRAAIEELRTLEAKAVDMSAATTDSVKKAGFEATVAEIRAAIKRKESEMPQTDLEAPGRIRSAFPQHPVVAISGLEGRNVEDLYDTMLEYFG